MTRPINLFLFAILLLTSGCATVGKSEHGIDNFDEVQPGALYRGAQPSRDGIVLLKQRGVRTVINLRDDPPPWEKGAAEQAGLHYVSIPMNAGNVDRSAVGKLALAMQLEPRPLFVHCKVGCDRTGLAVAMFRVSQQRWTSADAIKDLYAHGYHWLLFPGIERYVRTLP